MRQSLRKPYVPAQYKFAYSAAIAALMMPFVGFRTQCLLDDQPVPCAAIESDARVIQASEEQFERQHEPKF